MFRILHSEKGLAAIEFALIVPILLIVLLGAISLWSVIAQSSDMQDSVEAAASYLLQGGTDDNKALAIAGSAWRNRPADGEITIARVCSCSDAGASCSDPCPGTLLPPHTEITIEARGTWVSPTPVLHGYSSHLLTQQEIVRVR